MRSEKVPEGRVYVWMDEDSSETKPRLDGEPSALISAKDRERHPDGEVVQEGSEGRWWRVSGA